MFYAFTYEIDSISNGSTSKHKTVSFNDGKAWKEIYFTPGSANYSEPPKKNDAGIIYNQKLTAFHPGEDENNVIDFSNLENRPLIIKVLYSSGQMKLVGNKINYAELSDALNINQKTGHAITILREDYNKAFWLE